MQLSRMQELLGAKLLCGGEDPDTEITEFFASDMMSDVLAYPGDIHCLLTSLTNSQVVRTADMMDIETIVYVRGKTPPEEVIEMADQRDMNVFVTGFKTFEACGRLYIALRDE